MPTKDDDNVIIVIEGRGPWECPVGVLGVSCWHWEMCSVAVHGASGDKSWWGAQFSWMIAGGLIFMYRRPYLGGVHWV